MTREAFKAWLCDTVGKTGVAWMGDEVLGLLEHVKHSRNAATAEDLRSFAMSKGLEQSLRAILPTTATVRPRARL